MHRGQALIVNRPDPVPVQRLQLLGGKVPPAVLSVEPQALAQGGELLRRVAPGDGAVHAVGVARERVPGREAGEQAFHDLLLIRRVHVQPQAVRVVHHDRGRGARAHDPVELAQNPLGLGRVLEHAQAMNVVHARVVQREGGVGVGFADQLHARGVHPVQGQAVRGQAQSPRRHVDADNPARTRVQSEPHQIIARPAPVVQHGLALVMAI